ncbi:coiled-coil domain-containing protein [Tautonia sociabilis]|uniref:DUF4175 family protein n=1 Tax=Tautonia sociabilis TaxID=2080755 RepID=A0A432MQE6_9BACT|nr:hypothetical protein [Tautonia sociabilis]RUL89275.1 hypothetical protein TsocGM_02325 [Tautonia sociabilis]
MRDFDKPIGKVWRRLRFQRFLSALVWCLGGALVLAAVAIGLEKVVEAPALARLPDWAPFAAAVGAGLLLAMLIALLSGPSRLDAAVAIDRAFHLNERLGTALTLPDSLRESPAGRALIEDTKKQLGSLDISSKFGPRLPRAAWVPIVPGLIAVGLLFVPELTRATAKSNAALEPEQLEEIARQADALNKRIAEAREKIDDSKYAESDKLLVEIEKAAEELAKAPPAEKEQALITLNKLTNALQERQKQVGDSRQVSEKLRQLDQMTSDGPADEFARELAKGDFQQAAEKVKELRDTLLSGTMSDQEKEELKQQLAEMKEQLEQLANLEERKKQLQEALDRGAISQEQFEQQMARLNDQAEDLKKLQQLAQQLGQAQRQMAQGDMQQAAQALGMSQDQLQQMADDLAELELLDSAMADIQAAKDGMTGGDGLNQIGDRLSGMNAFGQGMGMGDGGGGLGQGRGQGDRPIAADDTSTFNTKVRQQLGRGKAVQEGFGPPNAQTVGESIIEAQATIEANVAAQAEALSNQKVPRHIEQHVQSYLDSFRGDN